MTTLSQPEVEAIFSDQGFSTLTLAIPCRAGQDPEEIAREAASAARRAYIARFGGVA